MYCERCGTLLPDDAIFCEVCGAKVQGPEGGGASGNGTKKLLMILGIIGAAILTIILAVVGFLWFYSGGDIDKPDYPDWISAETPTPIITETPTPIPTETPEVIKESTYIYVKKDCSWTQAQAECAGLGGHLVHFDTPGEVEKVIADFTSKGYNSKTKFWIGGARRSFEDSYTYYWFDTDGSSSGEISLADSHWMANEPSYIDPGLNNLIEDKMMLYCYKNEWVFNDTADQLLQYIPSYAGTIGYICEIEG